MKSLHQAQNVAVCPLLVGIEQCLYLAHPGICRIIRPASDNIAVKVLHVVCILHPGPKKQNNEGMLDKLAICALCLACIAQSKLYYSVFIPNRKLECRGRTVIPFFLFCYLSVARKFLICQSPRGPRPTAVQTCTKSFTNFGASFNLVCSFFFKSSPGCMFLYMLILLTVVA